MRDGVCTRGATTARDLPAPVSGFSSLPVSVLGEARSRSGPAIPREVAKARGARARLVAFPRPG